MQEELIKVEVIQPVAMTVYPGTTALVTKYQAGLVKKYIKASDGGTDSEAAAAKPGRRRDNA